jgi:dUTP pyrophosphatase
MCNGSCRCGRADGPTVNIQLIDNGVAPAYAKAGDAGADLVAREEVRIPAHQWALVPTGIKIEIPEGYVGLVHPRSGLALKQGITVLNTPGTIDAGYRGEVGVVLYNASPIDFTAKVGDRIAQLVIQKVETANFKIVDALTDTDRGLGGFGSTGVELNS